MSKAVIARQGVDPHVWGGLSEIFLHTGILILCQVACFVGAKFLTGALSSLAKINDTWQQ